MVVSEPSSNAPRNAWEALEGSWYYLGRPVAGGFDIATLVTAKPAERSNRSGSGRQANPSGGSRGEVFATAFSAPEAARGFLAAAPPGIELLRVDAADLRAKEEWLRALVDQGTATLVFDPRPTAPEADRGTPMEIAVHTALGYILSQRRATACL